MFFVVVSVASVVVVSVTVSPLAFVTTSVFVVTSVVFSELFVPIYLARAKQTSPLVILSVALKVSFFSSEKAPAEIALFT